MRRLIRCIPSILVCALIMLSLNLSAEADSSFALSNTFTLDTRDITLVVVSSADAGKVRAGAIPGGTFGEVIECAFPNTIKLDGNLDDLAWQHVPWHTVEHGDGPQPAPDN